MSNSVWPQRRQPTRLPRPWDSPGKNTGVGCHCLLQCMKVKSESEVAQSCPTPSNPMDCSPPGSSIHGIFQARVLEWGATAFSSANASIPNSHNICWIVCNFITDLIKNSCPKLTQLNLFPFWFFPLHPANGKMPLRGCEKWCVNIVIGSRHHMA